ncbi:MAG: DMT family transporter [Candidatus Limnocylindria bacterium]
MPAPARADRISLATFAAIALIGGGNAVGVAIAVDELDPVWAAGLRFLTAGAVFALILLVMRIPIPRGKALIGSAIYGLLGFSAAFALLSWGLQETPAGTAQTIIALVPLLTLFLAVGHGLERFSFQAVIGALLAFGGLVYLVADRIAVDVPPISMLAVVGGAAFLAESGVVLKLTPRTHPVATNAVGMLAGAVVLLVLSAAIGDEWILPSQADTWAAMVFLVVGGSLAVFGLFVFLLGRWQASSVSYVLLVMPLATIVYSAILTGEPITPALFIGGAIILGGVYIGALAPRRRAMASEDAATSS